jgi:hypothetical protein
VSSLLLSHTPHRRRTGGSSGANYRGVRFDLGGVSQLTFWRQGYILVPAIFIFYFIRLPLCNKYSDFIVTFISIHSVIIYVVGEDPEQQLVGEGKCPLTHLCPTRSYNSLPAFTQFISKD